MKDATRSARTALGRHLRRAVLTLDLPPGADVDEARLCAQFGLSRTPLREVFRELAGEGYLALRENRGARVADMAHTTLRDFFLAAPMIYAAVMRLAARNATPDQVAQLRAAQTVFRETLAQGSAADRTLANTRFHEITGEMAGNIYLLPSFRRLLIDHSRISMTFYQPHAVEMTGNQAEAARQHDAIINAIEARDEDAVAALAEAHWQLSRDRIEMFVMPGPLTAPLGKPPGQPN